MIPAGGQIPRSGRIYAGDCRIPVNLKENERREGRIKGDKMKKGK
jgi:hypothetical protein